MAIIITKNGRDTRKVEKSDFEQEDYLQKFIYDNPESIPLYDIKENIRLLVLCREFSTNSGPIDALGIDREGNIYLVETKLYKNPDKRLVVAQVLDYGASLWKSYSFEDFLNEINSFLNKKLKVTLNQRIKEFFSLEDDGVNTVIESIRSNLKEGNFKFVVLMDKLHQQLKDLIIFLNQNSEFDIFAIELEYYKFESYEILIPKIYGAEVKKDKIVSSSSRQKWDEEKFMNEVSKNFKSSELESIKKIYDFCKQNTTIYWGTGATRGSFNPVVDKIDPNRSILTLRSNGVLSLNFGWLNQSESSKKYRDLFGKLIQEKIGLKLQQDWIERYPEYKIKEWSKVTDKLIEVIDELIKN
jgi:hypothetical protein